MNVHVSYKAGKSAEVEREINQNIDKLSRRLQVFQPELVHLYATVSGEAHGNSMAVSLNLRLPSGQLAAQEAGTTPIAAVKAAFVELIRQLQRHKELLRGERGWYRKRGGRDIPGVPFEETSAAVPLPPHHTIEGAKGNGDARGANASGEVTNYLNANLERLESFIGREIRYREANGQLPPGHVVGEEVLDEVVVTALDEKHEKPANLTLERWLYRLAIQAVQRVARQNSFGANQVSMDGSAGSPNVSGSDESVLQFHQPDESLHQEDIIPEHTYGTPEEIASNDELVDQVERALAGGPPEDRQAMVLFALEGFTVEEIAAITDRDIDAVKRSIEGGREVLKRKLPAANMLRDRLLHRTRIA